MQKQQATFTTEHAPAYPPDNPAPYVQQPLASWDATQTQRVPPVKVPLPLRSIGDGDSARRDLSQPATRHPSKPGKARKSDTGAKSRTNNDKISKLSSIVRLPAARMIAFLVIRCTASKFELTCWPFAVQACKAMQERGGMPLEEFKRQRQQRLQTAFGSTASQRSSSPRKRSSSMTGTAPSRARMPHCSAEVTSRSVPATSARRPRRPCSSKIPDFPVAPGAAEPILPHPSSCAQTVLGSPPSSPSSAGADDDPIPGIMMATMESVRPFSKHHCHGHCSPHTHRGPRMASNFQRASMECVQIESQHKPGRTYCQSSMPAWQLRSNPPSACRSCWSSRRGFACAGQTLSCTKPHVPCSQ